MAFSASSVCVGTAAGSGVALFTLPGVCGFVPGLFTFTGAEGSVWEFVLSAEELFTFPGMEGNVCEFILSDEGLFTLPPQNR